jgi:hypothetical protein
MSWTEKFPKVSIPELPASEGPEIEVNNGEAWKAWQESVRAYNEAVRAQKRHIVAKAVDELHEREVAGGKLSASDKICLVLGISYLQEDLSGGTDIFNSLFGVFR